MLCSAPDWHSHPMSASASCLHPPQLEVTRMKLKPLGDRLIVRAIDEEETTASGLVLPDTAKEKPQKGEVLAVGDGKLDDDGKRIPLDVDGGRHRPLQQVRRHGDQGRRRGPAGPARVRRPRQGPRLRNRRTNLWLTRNSSTTRQHARPSRPASTLSPTPSRSRSAPRAATSSSTRSSAPRRSPTTVSPSLVRSRSRTSSRTRARSSSARSPRRPTTSPATARRPRPCSPRRSSATA